MADTHTTVEEQKEEAVDYLSLSDEEFFKVHASGINTEEDGEADNTSSGEEDIPEDNIETKEVDKEELEDTDTTDTGLEDTATDTDDAETVPETKEEDTDSTDAEGKVSTKTTDDTESVSQKDSSTSEDKIDYKAAYDKIFAPFKANGVQMQVKNADDAIRLMQMGANYNKKMEGLKPSLKLLKLLEKNKLTDTKAINYLIDLKNKNPKAITKLLQDSQIDPMELKLDKDSSYIPTDRNVTDTEIELDSVLEDIQSSPTYARTLNVVTKEWDSQSRNAIAGSPHIISIINDHVAAGIYDKVMGTVHYERSVGRLKGLSDFDAYRQIGDALHAAGKLGVATSSSNTVQTKAKPKQDIARTKRKKAASPIKQKTSSAAQAFNPLAMSDEEFAKFDLKKAVQLIK